jgi:DNA-binding MarR family transcriptional regulator
MAEGFTVRSMSEVSEASGGPVSQSAVRAAGDVWVVMGRLLRRLRELHGEDGLTPSQASVLVRLSKLDGASTSDLAAIERVRPQSMAKIVAGLEQAGLVTRRPDPDDGRRQLLALTELGVERRLGDRKSRQEWLVRELDARYTEEQRQTVIEAMALLDDVAQA